MALRFQQGAEVSTPTVDTIAEGMTVRVPEPYALETMIGFGAGECSLLWREVGVKVHLRGFDFLCPTHCAITVVSNGPR